MLDTPTIQQEAARTLLLRKKVQSSLLEWGKFFAAEKGFSLAKHHAVMLEKLQEAINGTLRHSTTGRLTRNIIISMPPGAAKSFYSSIVLPVGYLAQRKDSKVLACSHTADLIEGFSRECRNTVDNNSKTLGFGLRQDSKSVQVWATTNGGTYKCAGVGAAIAGIRADLGLIDDYIGSQEDADSELVRKKVWAWFISDFHTRLKPDAITVIIATRWHEDDLIGRLLDPLNKFNSPVSPSDWEYIKFPFFAEENDSLGRAACDMGSLGSIPIQTEHDEQLLQREEVKTIVGNRIWPEYFTPAMALGVLRKPPRVRAGLYQQRPAAEDGDYFQKKWLIPYTRDDMTSLMNSKPLIYGAGDWACTDEEEEAGNPDFTCFGPAAMGSDGFLYILPDIFWKQAGPEEVLQNFIALMKRRTFMEFWSEKGQISKSWGPFLRKMMLDEKVYQHITQVTPSKNKQVRAQSIRGLMSMGQVRFPTFAPWWEQAESQLLAFPGGKKDDFVDFIAYLGLGVNNFVKARNSVPPQQASDFAPQRITLGWVKKSHKEQMRLKEPVFGGR